MQEEISNSPRRDCGTAKPFASREECDAFFGHPYYADRAYAPATIRPGFNVWALVLGAYWCIYRKLYLRAAVYLITVDITMIAAVIAMSGNGGSPDDAGPALLVIMLVFRLILAKSINTVYIERGLKKIAAIRQEYAGNQAAALKAMAMAGGTNVTAVALFGFCSALINMWMKSLG